MKVIRSNYAFTMMFVLFTMGFLMSYSQLFNLYTISVPIGVLATVLFPIITWLLMYVSLKWINNSQSKRDLSVYTDKSAYVRVWMLGFEWILFIVVVLILNSLFALSWMRTVLWIVMATLSLVVYPRYLEKILDKAIIDESYRKDIFLKFKTMSVLIAGFGFILGFAAIILTLIGSVAKLFV